MKFIKKSDEIKDFQGYRSNDLSYYHDLKDLCQKFGKKHLRYEFLRISISSLFILDMFQRRIILGAMMS